MNEKQKKVLMWTAGVVVAMIIFPPFQSTGFRGDISNKGYGFILDPPYSANVNIPMLFVQWICAGVVGGIFFFIFKDNNNEGPKRNIIESEVRANRPENNSVHDPIVLPEIPLEKKELKGIGGWLLVLVSALLVIGPCLKIIIALSGSPSMGFFAALSFICGVVLLTNKDWSSVVFAKVVIWIVFPVAALFSNLGGSHISYSIIAAVIWTSYLSKSERVKNTYPNPSSPSQFPRRPIIA